MRVIVQVQMIFSAASREEEVRIIHIYAQSIKRSPTSWLLMSLQCNVSIPFSREFRRWYDMHMQQQWNVYEYSSG